MKYIRHRTLGFIIFEGTALQHADLAKKLGDPTDIVSAGFVFAPGTNAMCVGFSGSLNIPAAPTDSVELRNRLEALMTS